MAEHYSVEFPIETGIDENNLRPKLNINNSTNCTRSHE